MARRKKENLTAGIIGAGPMGEEIAQVLTKYYNRIILSDVDSSVLERVLSTRISEKNGWEGSADNEYVASESNILVTAVPLNKLAGVIKECGPRLDKEDVMMDASSVKTGPMELMQKYTLAAKKGVHTMYNPQDISMHGQKVIFVQYADDPETYWRDTFSAIFRAEGADLYLASPEMHDIYSAITQSMIHANAILWGELINELGLDASTVDSFSTPLSRLTSGQVGRMLSGPPAMLQTYAGIQRDNPKTLEALIAYRKLLNNHIRSVRKAVKNNDTSGIVNRFSSLKELLGKEFIDRHAQTVRSLAGVPRGTMVYFTEGRKDAVASYLGLKPSESKLYRANVEVRGIEGEPAYVNIFSATVPDSSLIVSLGLTGVPVAETICRRSKHSNYGHILFYIDLKIIKDGEKNYISSRYHDFESGENVTRFRLSPKQRVVEPNGITKYAKSDIIEKKIPLQNTYHNPFSDLIFTASSIEEPTLRALINEPVIYVTERTSQLIAPDAKLF